MTTRQSFKDVLNFELARLQEISLNNEYRNQFIQNTNISMYSRSFRNKKKGFLNSMLKFFIHKK